MTTEMDGLIVYNWTIRRPLILHGLMMCFRTIFKPLIQHRFLDYQKASKQAVKEVGISGWYKGEDFLNTLKTK